MGFSPLDWAIVAAYFAATAFIGFWFTKRASSSVSEYFVSGRNVPWWLAGVSLVATTFAADTPLAVTGMVASKGVAGNWLWWNMVMSGVLTVFFFARLWRRAGVMTDAELAEVRYGGKPAAILRGFRAAYLALAINLIIIGWVTAAMIKILTIALGISPWTAVIVCFLFTAAYSMAGGMWAALWTDAFQFVLMMSAVIVLAFYAVDKVGGMDALIAGVSAHFGTDGALSVLPVDRANNYTPYVWLPGLTLGTFLAVQWWAAWYPGSEPGGGGYVAQRIFSARTERDGVLATLFFQIAHYALRPWPWIVTGLATIILYPNLTTDGEREAAYVHAFVDLLPTPWRGIMLAGFFAAFMSTIATQLNWGASYLVNDIYKRFIAPPDVSQKRLVTVARVSTIVLFILGLYVTSKISSVEKAWKFLLALGAGTGLVLILRWYWWRINAWSEISSMIASLAISIIAMQVVPGWYPAGDPRTDSTILLITAFGSMLVWIPVTFLTQPESDKTLQAFYQRVRPGGRGWMRISTSLGYGREPIPGGALNWTNWVAGVVAVYSSLFGIGKIVFGDYGLGLGFFALAAVCFAWIARSLGPETPRAT